jgi:hypothetical protein
MLVWLHCVSFITTDAASCLLCRCEIVQLQAGAERQRRKRLSTAAVVGVTCCAALQVRASIMAAYCCSIAALMLRSPAGAGKHVAGILL